jgi:hypothetical protein
MAANRLSAFVLVALVPALLASACVNLTPPWVGATGASSAGGTAAGGSAAGGLATGGTSGVDTGGSAAGGLAAGGTSGVVTTGGVIGPDTGGASGAATGGSTASATGGAGAVAAGGSTATPSGGATVAGGGTADAAGALGGSTNPGDAAPPSDLPLTNDVPALVEAPLLRDAPVDPPSSPDLPLIPDAPLPSDAIDSAVSTAGLLAYYKCDETTGTTLSDSSGNGKNGTLVGPATFGPGKIGNALILTATNGVDGGASGGYAQLPAGLLTSIQTMTVAAWFMVNSNTKFQRVFDFGTSSTTSSMYFTPFGSTGTPGFPQFSIRTVLTDGGLNKEDLVGTTAITISPAWHHVAVVLDATGGHLYLDGGLVFSNAAMTLRPADLGAMPNDWIGRSEFPNDPYFDGDIDEFRVYNRALTAAEVLALFNGQ